MSITKTKIGSWVCFTNIDAGDSYDKMFAYATLNIGERYLVTGITIHDWHTDVYLDNRQIPFNSVLFDNCNLM